MSWISRTCKDKNCYRVILCYIMLFYYIRWSHRTKYQMVRLYYILTEFPEFSLPDVILECRYAFNKLIFPKLWHAIYVVKRSNFRNCRHTHTHKHTHRHTHYSDYSDKLKKFHQIYNYIELTSILPLNNINRNIAFSCINCNIYNEEKCESENLYCFLWFST